MITKKTTSVECARIKGTGGIQLPSPGGTASVLNYYEEYSIATTVSGPWASAQNVTAKFIRIGKIVTLTLGNSATIAVLAVNSAASTITMALNIPVVFRPAFATVVSPIIVTNVGNRDLGLVEISSGGTLTIRTATAPGTFNNAGNNVGFQNFCITWQL